MKARWVLASLAAIALSAPGCSREEALDGDQGGEESAEPREDLTPARREGAAGVGASDAAAERQQPKFGEKGGEEMATATPVDHLNEIEVELKTVRELLTHVEAEPLALSEEQTRRFMRVKDRAMDALQTLEERVGELKELSKEAEKPKTPPSL